MKKVLGLLFAVALVFALFGCQEKVTELQMLWWSDGTEGEVMQELLDEYFDETGVTIELVSIPYNDYETRLATMISGGEAPALARVTEGHLNNFKEQILSLEAFMMIRNSQTYSLMKMAMLFHYQWTLQLTDYLLILT